MLRISAGHMRATAIFCLCLLGHFETACAALLLPGVPVSGRTVSAPSSARCADIIASCPLTRPQSDRESASESATSPAGSLAVQLERSAQQLLGVNETLGVVVAKVAIAAALQAICDELQSFDVNVAASNTWQMLTLPQKPGSVTSASISATGVSAGGLRASACELAFPHGISADFGNPFGTPPTLPNLAAQTEARFSVRLSQDDLTRSPILFASLEALLRELIRSGASAAIGRVLPADSDALRIRLRSVESLRDGRVTLVADGSTSADDGSTVTLAGLRVRTRVSVSRVERLIVLRSPELLSTFEGLGAKVEVGLPFLRGAGVPLPDGLDVESLRVEDGAITARGTFQLRPIDYQRILDDARAFEQTAARRPPTATTVDAEAFVVDDNDGPPAPPSVAGALPNGVM